MGVDGVYARTALYVDLVERLEQYITRQRDPAAEIMRFPPVMSRTQLEKSGYLKSFPNLLGCVCALHGSEASIRAAVERYDNGGDWTTSLTSSDLVLSPAACYPVYPIAAARGKLPAGGLLFDIEADVFRHEPSLSLDRLQSFRMREFVRIGAPDEIVEFREKWMAKAPLLAAELGLPHTMDVAPPPPPPQRSVLRQSGPGHGREPAPTGFEIRALDSLLSGRFAHGVHELQLSSRAFRAGVGHP